MILVNEEHINKGKRMATAFATIFRGRPDAWGQLPEYCQREPVTFAHYEKHLRGEVSLGIYPFGGGGVCYFAISGDVQS